MKDKIQSHKGFTLIELLVVISIIALLATAGLVALRGAQIAGRDTRRIADIRAIQSALELYYTKCGIYPGNDTCASVDPTTWSSLSSTLTGAGIGITSVPVDPVPSRTYDYAVRTSDPSRQSYILAANLERSSSILNDPSDLDSMPAGTWSKTLTCTDTSPNFWYCVQQ